MSTTVHRAGTIDQRDKTISVPVGSGLEGKLNESLTSTGWKTYSYFPSSADFHAPPSSPTRGRYLLSVHTVGGVKDFDRWWGYDLAVIDQKNSQEVLTMKGSAYESVIAHRFIEEMSK